MPVSFGFPFAQGEVKTDSALTSLRFGEQTTQWRPLAWWPDGSIFFALADLQLDFPGKGSLDLDLQPRPPAAKDPPFRLHPAVADALQKGLRLRLAVRDVRGGTYEATILEPSSSTVPAGAGAGDGGSLSFEGAELVEDGPLKKTFVFRGAHEPKGEGTIGRDFLRYKIWVTFYSGLPWVSFEHWFGNAYVEDPLGDVILRAARIEFLHPGTTPQAWIWELPSLSPTRLDPTRPEERTVLEIFPEGEHLLGDAQIVLTRGALDFAGRGFATFEFPPNTRVRFDRYRETFPDLLWTEGVDWERDAAAALAAARKARGGNGRFGHLGVDPVLDPSTAGSPRNEFYPDWFPKYAVSGRRAYLALGERFVAAQANRPYHLDGYRYTDHPDSVIWKGKPHKSYRDTLGRDKVGRWDVLRGGSSGGKSKGKAKNFRHGWGGWSYEHFTVAEAFFTYLLTGNLHARDEMQVQAHEIASLQYFNPAYTESNGSTRARGWCLLGILQAWLCTRDPDLLQAMHNIVLVTDRYREKTGKNPYDPDGSKGFATRYYKMHKPKGDHLANSYFDVVFQLGIACFGFGEYLRFFPDDEVARNVLVDLAWCITRYGYKPGKGFRYDIVCYTPVDPNKPPDDPPYHFGKGVNLWVMAGLLEAWRVEKDPLFRQAAEDVLRRFEQDGEVGPDHKYWGWFQGPWSVLRGPTFRARSTSR